MRSPVLCLLALSSLAGCQYSTTTTVRVKSAARVEVDRSASGAEGTPGDGRDVQPWPRTGPRATPARKGDGSIYLSFPSGSARAVWLAQRDGSMQTTSWGLDDADHAPSVF